MFDLSINVWIWKWFLQNLNYFPLLLLARSGVISGLNSPTLDQPEEMSNHILVLCVQAARQLRMFNLKSSIKSENSQNHSLVLEDKENCNWWLGKLFIWASVCWRWLIVAHLPRNVDFRLRPPKFHHDRDAANEKIWHHKSSSRCKYELSWKSSKQFS